PKDGALYFAIGGRTTMSGLYRITYIGKESTAYAKPGPTGTGVNVLIDRDKLASLGIEVGTVNDALRSFKGQSTPDELGRIVIKKNPAGDILLRDVATVKVETVSYRKQRDIRKKLESFYGKRDAGAIETAWPYLSDEDRFLRYAARTVLEFQDPATWQD